MFFGQTRKKISNSRPMLTRSMTRRNQFANLHADIVSYMLSQLSIDSVIPFGITSKVHHTVARDEVLGRHRAALRALREAQREEIRAWDASRRLHRELKTLNKKVNQEWRDQVVGPLQVFDQEWAPAGEDQERLQELYDQCSSIKEKEATLQQVCRNASAAITQLNKGVKDALGK